MATIPNSTNMYYLQTFGDWNICIKYMVVAELVIATIIGLLTFITFFNCLGLVPFLQCYFTMVFNICFFQGSSRMLCWVTIPPRKSSTISAIPEHFDNFEIEKMLNCQLTLTLLDPQAKTSTQSRSFESQEKFFLKYKVQHQLPLLAQNMVNSFASGLYLFYILEWVSVRSLHLAWSKPAVD